MCFGLKLLKQDNQTFLSCDVSVQKKLLRLHYYEIPFIPAPLNMT